MARLRIRKIITVHEQLVEIIFTKVLAQFHGFTAQIPEEMHVGIGEVRLLVE